MSLTDTIQKDLVAAMKARESLKLGALRMVKAALANKRIELKADLSLEQELQVVTTLVKQRNESIEMYEKGGREELAEKERAEREILQAYLPESVSEEEIASVVDSVIQSLGASSAKDIGAVMKQVLASLKPTGKTVDGKQVNAVVRSRLR